MHLKQATDKLAAEIVTAYNQPLDRWEKLEIPGILASTDRRIGRTKAFFDRRVLLTAKPIKDSYQLLRVTGSPSTYLVYSYNANVNRGVAYINEYALLEAEPTKAQLIELTKTTYASGATGLVTETILGEYYVSVSRYATDGSPEAKGIDHTKVDIFIPTFAQVSQDKLLRINGVMYDIKEVISELRLTRLEAVKR